MSIVTINHAHDENERCTPDCRTALGTPVVTGLLDRNGVEIKIGDFVSLDGNMTTDDSLGDLPNGWTFDETDVYEVYFDERIAKYSLKLGVEPDSRYNVKYMNHALTLLYEEDVEIVPRPAEILDAEYLEG